MGNKKSTPPKNVAVPGADVPRREAGKGGAKQRKPRPASDPTGAASTANLPSGFNPNPHGQQEFNKTSPQSATSHEPPTDYYEQIIPAPALSDSALPPGYHSAAQRDDYGRAADQVLAIWPEYKSIQDVTLSNFQPQVLTTLQQMYKRLCEQHGLIKLLSEEKHENKQILSELQDERNAHVQALRRKDLDMHAMKEDITILRAELRKVQTDYRRFEVDGKPDRPRSDSAVAMPTDDGQHPKYRKREKGGIYKATPLLQAEGVERTRSSVQRTQSLRPLNQPTTDSGIVRTDSLRGVDSSDNRLVEALENERRENDILKQRLHELESSLPYSKLPRKTISVEVLVERFIQLETSAIDRLSKTLESQLSHVNVPRRSQFLCSVMQTCYKLSLRSVLQCKDIVQSVVMNPFKQDFHPSPNDDSTDQRSPVGGAVSGHIKKFEQSPDRAMSKLAMRTLNTGEIPDMLVKQIATFLENTSDANNLATLAESVVDVLGQEYQECVTPAVLGQAAFNQFLHDCCRLAWQMSVLNPPMSVCSNGDKWRFDGRYHVTHLQDNVTNAQIDYYLWPILYSKQNGELLSKGRVSLKVA